MESVKMESVVQVKTNVNFKLELLFNTGELKLFDMKPYLDKGAFTRLKNVSIFNQAYIAFDTVCWPGNLDISPATLYDKSKVLA